MLIRSDEATSHFRIGDAVRAIGKPQVMRVIECREGMAHIHIEASRSIHYKCEWRHPDGSTHSKWYEGSTLEKAW